MSRRALSVAVACAVPPALAGNALLLIAWGWLPRLLYALPGFPGGGDLEGSARLELAQTGVDSIQPWDGNGMDVLREATLPSGLVAFTSREVAHMQDVRDLMTALLIAWAIAVALLACAWLATRARQVSHEAVRAGLRAGALASIALLTALALFMLGDFDSFFTAFHGLFFDGDSWRFAEDDTLRLLYPYAFWGVSGTLLAGLTIGQALALALVARPRRRLEAWTSS